VNPRPQALESRSAFLIFRNRTFAEYRIPAFGGSIGQMDEFGYPELSASLQELGRIIRARRHASYLRIDDAAALCDVSVDPLSRLENGKSGVGSDRPEPPIR
jgi:hypothetical protein